MAVVGPEGPEEYVLEAFRAADARGRDHWRESGATVMTFNRLYVGQEVDLRLKNLKARTGLTPNLICRLGFCLSLAEPGIPDSRLYADGHVREFNRYTLTGQWDTFFFSLLRERLVRDGLDLETDLEHQFKAHLSRGVLLLYKRMKTLGDLEDMVAQSQKRAALVADENGVEADDRGQGAFPTSRLHGPPRDHAGRPAGARGDAALLHRAFRERRQHRPRVRRRGRAGRRGRARSR